MIIKAKFESNCLRCGELITVGERISWNPGDSGARHEKCPKGALEKKAAEERALSIGKLIIKNGERPAGMNTAEGEKVIDKTTIYGGGYWYVIESDWIWYVRNNSSDGDDWGASNVVGIGPGGIGWRVRYDEELAQKIRDIANIFNS